MAVRSTPASDAPRTVPAGSPAPVRTCIGCRQRAAATELLRVVAEPASAKTADRPAPGNPGSSGADVVSVVPDPRRRASGRGAWLHPEPGCVDLAQRRRAFGRALRVTGAIDPARVREYVEQLAQRARPN